MLDELINQCREPVNFWLHIVSFVFGVWGLWMHNSVAILLAIILIAAGHIYANRRIKPAQKASKPKAASQVFSFSKEEPKEEQKAEAKKLDSEIDDFMQELDKKYEG